jgi:RHS repeat-associated protein
VTSTKQFVWCDDTRCEARNAAGSVTAQYFVYGQTLNGTDYFYSKDQLNSVREMTNSSGVIQAEYAYDPFGRATQIEGSVASDFLFADYYLHSPSGLNLTQNRAYSSALGRFLNRDPVQEDGGVNLYAYVLNEPIISVDPSGLLPFLPCASANCCQKQVWHCGQTRNQKCCQDKLNECLQTVAGQGNYTKAGMNWRGTYNYKNWLKCPECEDSGGTAA